MAHFRVIYFINYSRDNGQDLLSVYHNVSYTCRGLCLPHTQRKSHLKQAFISNSPSPTSPHLHLFWLFFYVTLLCNAKLVKCFFSAVDMYIILWTIQVQIFHLPPCFTWPLLITNSSFVCADHIWITAFTGEFEVWQQCFQHCMLTCCWDNPLAVETFIKMCEDDTQISTKNRSGGKHWHLYSST